MGITIQALKISICDSDRYRELAGYSSNHDFGEFTFSIKNIRDAPLVPNHIFKVFIGKSILTHVKFQNIYGVCVNYGKMFFFIIFNDKGQEFKLVKVMIK